MSLGIPGSVSGGLPPTGFDARSFRTEGGQAVNGSLDVFTFSIDDASVYHVRGMTQWSMSGGAPYAPTFELDTTFFPAFAEDSYLWVATDDSGLTTLIDINGASAGTTLGTLQFSTSATPIEFWFDIMLFTSASETVTFRVGENDTNSYTLNVAAMSVIKLGST